MEWWYVVKRVDDDKELARTNSRKRAVGLAKEKANELGVQVHIIPEKEED